MTNAASPQVGPVSRRVALSATGLVAVVYSIVSLAIVAWAAVSLTAQVDTRLARVLAFEADAGSDGRPFGRERATWSIATDGTVTSNRDDLTLGAEYHQTTEPQTIVITGSEIRIMGVATDGGHLVVGESMDPVDDAITTVILGELLIAPFLLVAVFFGSLTIGRRVAMPIERARQRQLAFTADASHELRTPLSVIEANASLALVRERDSNWYRRSFERIVSESNRMSRLIESLLWLARFDAMERAGEGEPVELGVLAGQAADRFAAVAESKSLALEVRSAAAGATLSAPEDWIDQLIGVLLDNACKYSPPGGRVVVSVANVDRRVLLAVDDNGPGIPEERRERIFDRFHRDMEMAAGAGLGLAIADAIVRASSGRWQIGISDLGGARMSVSWAESRGGRGTPTDLEQQREAATRQQA